MKGLAVFGKCRNAFNEFMRDLKKRRMKAKYEAKREKLWVRYPDAMCAMEAANLLESFLDEKRYTSTGDFMCIVAKHAHAKIKIRPGVSDRLISIINMEIYPHATLHHHLMVTKGLSSPLTAESRRRILDLGVPYYRELVKKIRKAHGFLDYMEPYKG
jgi:hypothetical protein